MIGFYNYTVILTYIGTAFGFLGVTFSWNGNLKAALLCLIVAGFCDMFDGKIASTMKRTSSEKNFGIQIDSLSDLICFGLLPAAIAFGFSNSSNKVLNAVYIAISITYLLCALIRLAWFNVDEAERQCHETEARKTYRGLPVTSSAAIFPLFMGAGLFFDLPMDKIFPWILLAVAIAFISPFPLKKPKFLGKLVLTTLGVLGVVAVIFGVPSI